MTTDRGLVNALGAVVCSGLGLYLCWRAWTR